ncbi:hypothetical protein [Neobacillus drentensis]|uniref:hypothetical protein n=1 Tax=Neobacillus drentensis TaxID=220684 RepID=UPI002856350B|nr:hypothetical protein [Neobacillus drentensis]MDR7237169.1 hypothetical protein [Neobacillus drentensis]
MKEIENPMVIDSLWRDREKEPEVIDECLGCLEDIVAGEDVYKFVSVTGETVRVHQNSECCQQYIGALAVCEIAGDH